MNEPMWHRLRRTAARLLLIAMAIGAAGLAFGRDIPEGGPAGADSIPVAAGAAQPDRQSGESPLAGKPCGHGCHGTCHVLGQLPSDTTAATPELARQYPPRLKHLTARDHTAPSLRPGAAAPSVKGGAGAAPSV